MICSPFAIVSPPIRNRFSNLLFANPTLIFLGVVKHSPVNETFLGDPLIDETDYIFVMVEIQMYVCIGYAKRLKIVFMDCLC